MSVRTKVIAAVAVSALAAHTFTLLDFHDEQDQCSFGPVSNARYRELLSEAEHYQRRRWPLLIWNSDRLEELLSRQFLDMTRDSASTYERVATMHAIFRGIGADFLYTQPNDGFADIADRGGSVSFGYHINVHRLALLYPLGRTGWLIGSLAGPSQSSRRGQPKPDYEPPQGQLRFVAHYPNPFDPIPGFQRGPDACPAVPNSDLEPLFRPMPPLADGG